MVFAGVTFGIALAMTFAVIEIGAASRETGTGPGSVPAHASRHRVLLQDRNVLRRSVLNASIGVVHQSG